MRRTILLTALLALTIAPAAMARPTTVKGAMKCALCHEGAPKDKVFNAATKKMFPKYKESQCKDCHGYADGKLTIIKPAK